MTVEKKIYNDGRYLVCHITDEVRGEDLVSLLHWIMKQFQDNILKPDYRVLLDLKDIGRIQIDEADVLRISQINITYRQPRGQVKTAIVVASEPGRELANLHKSLSAAVDILVEIFDSEQAACEWLEIDIETIVDN